MPMKTRSQTKTTTQETPDEPLSRMEEFKRQLLLEIEMYFGGWLWDIPGVRQAALDKAMANIGPVMMSQNEIELDRYLYDLFDQAGYRFDYDCSNSLMTEFSHLFHH
jgi:hypothetical protein